MANTIDTALVSDTISETVLTQLTEKLAPLEAFSTDFGVDPLKPSSTVQVGIVTAGSTTLTNATSWEAGDSVVDNRPVTVNQYSQPFHITAAELNSGHKLMTLARKNAQALGNKIMDVTCGVMTVANFGAGIETDETAGGFGVADLKTIWGSKESMMEKNIILNGALYANFLPSNLDSFDPTKSRTGVHGFDGFYHNGRFNGASAADVTGFFGDKSAIAVAAGLPVDDQAPDGEFLVREVIPINEQLGLSALFTVWYSRASRSTWGSLDVMFGAGLGDASAGSLLVNSVAD